MHQPGELADINLYEWVKYYKREKLPKKKQRCDLPVDKDRAISADGSCDISLSLVQNSDIDSEHDNKPDKKNTKKSNNIMHHIVQLQCAVQDG